MIVIESGGTNVVVFPFLYMLPVHGIFVKILTIFFGYSVRSTIHLHHDCVSIYQPLPGYIHVILLDVSLQRLSLF